MLHDASGSSRSATVDPQTTVHAPKAPERPQAAPVQDVELAADFRLAMRRFASTITILSTTHGGERFGMAATAVSSISTAPPSLLVCVNRSASIHRPIDDGGRFCVNLLSDRHADLVPPFSGGLSGEARFSVGGWEANNDGVPFLADAQASIFCTLDRSIVYGTHSIFIGRVEEVQMTGDAAPLVYQDGSMRRTTVLAP